MPLDRLIAASPEEVGIDADAMAALFVRSRASPDAAHLDPPHLLTAPPS